MLVLQAAAALAGDYTLTQFSDGTSNGNLTYNSDNNQYNKSVELPINSTINEFRIDLQGYRSPTPNVTISLNIDQLNMTDGCNGEVGFAPNSTHVLSLCVDGVDDSCQNYTSGVYNASSQINTSPTQLNMSDTYRLKLTWNKVSYINLDNSTLNGKNDSGASQADPYNSTCASGGINQYSCIDGAPYVGNAFYTASYGGDCDGGSYTLVYRRIPSGQCRVYDGYTRMNGSNAIVSGCTAGYHPLNDIYCQGTNDWYAYTSCTSGTAGSCPSSLCTYAGSNSVYLDYFTLNSTLTHDINITDKVTLTGNITYELDYPQNLSIYMNNTLVYNNISDFNGSVDNLDLNVTVLELCTNSSASCPVEFRSDGYGIVYFSDLFINYSKNEISVLYINESLWSTSLYSDSSASHTISVNNSGDWNATNCTLKLSSVLNNYLSFTPEFNLSINESVNITITLTNPPSATYDEYLDLVCYDATDEGTEIHSNSDLRVQVVSSARPPVSGGGGGGGDIIIVGNVTPVLDWGAPSYTITLLWAPREVDKSFIVTNRGNDRFVGGVFVSEKLQEYADLTVCDTPKLQTCYGQELSLGAGETKTVQLQARFPVGVGDIDLEAYITAKAASGQYTSQLPVGVKRPPFYWMYAGADNEKTGFLIAASGLVLGSIILVQLVRYL